MTKNDWIRKNRIPEVYQVTTSDSQPNSRPLELTAPIWIGLAVVALLGVANQWRQQEIAQTLKPGQPFHPTIVRHRESTHQFVRLGVEVSLTDGWTYLELTDDAIATQATLVHPPSHSIVSLRINRLDSWPPQGYVAQKEGFAHVNVDWISLRLPRVFRLEETSTIPEATRGSHLTWTDFDPRHLGRLTPRRGGAQKSEQEESEREKSEREKSEREASDLMMIVVTHQHGENVNAAVRELCDSMRFLNPGARASGEFVESDKR